MGRSAKRPRERLKFPTVVTLLSLEQGTMHIIISKNYFDDLKSIISQNQINFHC